MVTAVQTVCDDAQGMLQNIVKYADGAPALLLVSKAFHTKTASYLWTQCQNEAQFPAFKHFVMLTLQEMPAGSSDYKCFQRFLAFLSEEAQKHPKLKPGFQNLLRTAKSQDSLPDLEELYQKAIPLELEILENSFTLAKSSLELSTFVSKFAGGLSFFDELGEAQQDFLLLDPNTEPDQFRRALNKYLVLGSAAKDALQAKLQTSEAIKNVRSLNFLSSSPISALPDNHVSALPEEIELFTNLESLDVSASPGLTYLPKSIAKLKKLQQFTAHDSGIKEFPKELYDLPHLRRVSITQSDPSVLPPLTSLPSIDRFKTRVVPNQMTRYGKGTSRHFNFDVARPGGGVDHFRIKSYTARIVVPMHYLLEALNNWNKQSTPSRAFQTFKAIICSLTLAIVAPLLMLCDIVLRAAALFGMLLAYPILLLGGKSSRNIRNELWKNAIPVVAKGYRANIGLTGVAMHLWAQNFHKRVWDVEKAEKSVEARLGWNLAFWHDQIYRNNVQV